MPDPVAITLAEVEPRRTAVIAATIAWEDFPNLWRPMLDEVYAFVRRCARPMPGHCGGRIIESRLPGGRAVTATHHADPGRIGATHDAAHEYARAHRLQMAAISWEVYGHPDESGAVDTEVYHLVAA